MSVGLDVERILRALADQIRANVTSDVTVTAYPSDDTPNYPKVSVLPEPDFMSYGRTFGSAGVAELRLRVRVEAPGESAESSFVQMCRFLSVGTGHGSSIPDAIMIDKTLDGVVQDCTVGDAEYPDPDELPWTADVTVRVMTKKIGAQT